MNRQAGTLLVLSTKRPVTGRDGLATIEGEDYDGQSGAKAEDSNDTDLGQSITVSSGGSIFYDVVDFSDGGVGSVQLRVQASSATTLELHADSATGTLLGKCAITATGTSWATQNCSLSPITGVHTLYVLFNGAAHLNWLLFQAGGGSNPGTGGSSGTGGSPGTGGSATGGASGLGGRGGSGTGGSPGTGGSMVSGTGGSPSGTGGNASSGSGGSGTGGASTGGNTGSTGSGGAPPATGGSSGCACSFSDGGGELSWALLLQGLVATAGACRRRRRRSP